ncbi:hypothetical protein Pa4123_59760 [Phytohabitans aurantiacus]|uniref:CBM6 domain-containing protein n=2 Tax=Phytohabitans aurantiacus TaxID=3016789 RepID=A0ABQ5R2P7_9ACTN|nr:hypothetical protein Pa4123_59760 [Phytohabitans aurantiacus]
MVFHFEPLERLFNEQVSCVGGLMTVRDERDTWLAGLARAGNGRALDELLERHWSVTHHIIGCGLVEHSDVEPALTALAARLRDTAPGGEQVRAWFAAEARRQVRESRRPGRAGPDGPDFAATAVARLGLTGQARHLVEALRWLAPHDRDTFALWWLAEAGELTPAEVAAASGDSPSDSDARVRRMAPRLDAARRLVAALAADPVCGDLALLAGGTARRPEPHRRDRLAAHVVECSRCATDLEPVEPLLGSLGLVPAPAIPRPPAQSRSSAAPSIAPSIASSTAAASDRRQNSGVGWRRFTRPRGPAAPEPATDRAKPPTDRRPSATRDAAAAHDALGASDATGSLEATGRRDAAGSLEATGRRDAAGSLEATGRRDAAGSPETAVDRGVPGVGDAAVGDGSAGSHESAVRRGGSGWSEGTGRRGVGDSAGSADAAAERGAAGARRYTGRLNSAASWTDLTTGDAAPGGTTPASVDPTRGSGASAAASGDAMSGSRGSAAALGTTPDSRGSDAVWGATLGSRGPAADAGVPLGSSGPAAGSGATLGSSGSAPGSGATLDSRGSVASRGRATGSAGARRPARPGASAAGSAAPAGWAGSASAAGWVGSAAAGLRTRLARPLAWAAEAGLRSAAAVRGLASRIVKATSGLRYRGRRFRPTSPPRRAILIALAVAMFVIVALVANGATRSAAPVHDPEPVNTALLPEPSPAAVTTVAGTPPAAGLAPLGRAVAPERTPRPATTSAAAVPPTPRPPTTTSYEAEAARLHGSAEPMMMPEASGGRIVHRLGTGANPYGYTDRGAIEFTLNAPTARRYAVTIYYVDGEQQRTVYARLNGGQSQAWSLRPGGWGTVMSATFQLDLRAGANSLYLHNPAYWMPRLDRLTTTG